MPGRLPTYTVLKTNGLAAQKFVFYGILLDSDYDVISAGAFPDSGSVAGQLSVSVFAARGGSRVGSGSPAVVAPTATDFAGAYGQATAFGAIVERLIGDVSDPNYFVPLWGTLNPKFYNRMIRLRSGQWLIAVLQDNSVGDAVVRSATIEMMAIPTDATGSREQTQAAGA